MVRRGERSNVPLADIAAEALRALIKVIDEARGLTFFKPPVPAG